MKAWYFERDFTADEKAVLGQDELRHKAALVVLRKLSHEVESFRKRVGVAT